MKSTELTPLLQMAIYYDHFKKATEKKTVLKGTEDMPNGPLEIITCIPWIGVKFTAECGSNITVCHTEYTQGSVKVGDVVAVEWDGATPINTSKEIKDAVFILTDGRDFLPNETAIKVVNNVIIEIITPE